MQQLCMKMSRSVFRVLHFTSDIVMRNTQIFAYNCTPRYSSKGRGILTEIKMTEINSPIIFHYVAIVYEADALLFSIGYNGRLVLKGQKSEISLLHSSINHSILIISMEASQKF